MGAGEAAAVSEAGVGGVPDMGQEFRKSILSRCEQELRSQLSVLDVLLSPLSVSFVVLSCQNEEVLKKCAQEYLSRVKKEEQRYQALKVHAEEKLDR